MVTAVCVLQGEQQSGDLRQDDVTVPARLAVHLNVGEAVYSILGVLPHKKSRDDGRKGGAT